MSFYIWYEYQDLEPENIDEFDNMEEAQTMLREYRMCYGAHSRVWIGDSHGNNLEERSWGNDFHLGKKGRRIPR